VLHGFLRAPDGIFNTIDPPGSTGSSALSINPAGAIAGVYYDPNSVPHGFLWIPYGKK
jgi:hypothetical protein